MQHNLAANRYPSQNYVAKLDTLREIISIYVKILESIVKGTSLLFGDPKKILQPFRDVDIISLYEYFYRLEYYPFLFEAPQFYPAEDIKDASLRLLTILCEYDVCPQEELEGDLRILELLEEIEVLEKLQATTIKNKAKGNR